MPTRASATLLAMLLLGCAGASPPVAAPSPAPAAGPPPVALVGLSSEVAVSPPPSPAVVQPPPPPGAGAWAVSVLGTPFYLAFKAVTCVGSAAIAAPIAALVALTPDDGETIAVLGEGLAWNCGPPYALTPSETVAVLPVEQAATADRPNRSPDVVAPRQRAGRAQFL